MNTMTLANKLAATLGSGLVAEITVAEAGRFLDGHMVDALEDVIDQAQADARLQNEEQFVLIRVRP